MEWVHNWRHFDAHERLEHAIYRTQGWSVVGHLFHSVALRDELQIKDGMIDMRNPSVSEAVTDMPSGVESLDQFLDATIHGLFFMQKLDCC